MTSFLAIAQSYYVAMLLTRRFSFSASHRLTSTHMDGPTNEKHFGVCQRVHGHNYRLEVTISGTVSAQSGFFCNVLILEQVVHQYLVAPCDHQMLNDLPLFHGQVPTMEVVAQVFWNTLKPELAQRNIQLAEILLAETDDHWVRVTDC